MKILTLCLLAASASASFAQAAPTSAIDLDARQFDHVRFGEPVSELPFPCQIMCEGLVGSHWFIIGEKDHKVAVFSVLYNTTKMSGEPFASHTLDLTDALREHSYSNSHAPFDLAMSEDADGNVLAWLDMNLKIAYFVDPTDKAKGIIRVVYAPGDAPIFARAKRVKLLTELSTNTYAAIVEMEKRGYPHR